MERKIVRGLIADQGDRGVLPQGGINEGQESAGAIIESDQRHASRPRGEDKASTQGAAQVKLNARPPFGGHGRGGQETITREGGPEEDLSQG